MSSCPSCSQNINPFSFSLSAFPLYFKCPNCNVRLKLINSKLFWVIFFLYLIVVVTSIIYITLIREYNFSVIVAVLGWFAVYKKLSFYILRKENVALYK
jgi:lipopolysaccharide export LptBFGC system permease protein LptF